MKHELKRLLPRHFRIMELVLLGKKQTEIAEELGLSNYGVSVIINSPVFQEELGRRREEQNAHADEVEVVRRLNAREVLDRVAVEVAQRQVALLESPDERVAQKAAMDILDRTGYPKVSRAEGQHVVASIILDEKYLERIQETTRLLDHCLTLAEDVQYIFSRWALQSYGVVAA
jgi:predicted transcriptional regulator